MHEVAKLAASRWTDRERFLQEASAVIPDLQARRLHLDELGATILENDLAPQIGTLKGFTALPVTPQQEGELTVKTGTLEIAYYAVVRHKLRGTIDTLARTEASAKGRSGLSFTSFNAAKVEDDPLSDIWAGLEAEQMIDSASWRLPPVDMQFRGKPVTFLATLRYYNFGLFSLTFQTDIDGLSASAVRHMASLGSPIALDENLIWRGHNRRFGTFEAFAQFLFPEVEAEIERIIARTAGVRAPRVGQEAEQTLRFDTILNRFTAVRVDKLSLVEETGERLVAPEEALAHPAFKALTLPALEARCAIDDWIMRRPQDASQNLAPLRYYAEGDLMLACRHDGVICLLNQANWVRDQAWEAMTVSAAITNFFCYTNALFNRRVRNPVMRTSTPEAHLEKDPRLRERLQQTRDDLQDIQGFEQEVERMLDTMEAGHVMRFPDLTLLVNGLFGQLGFAHLTEQTRTLLAQAREMQQFLFERLSRTQEAIKAKRAEQLNFIARIIVVLVGLAQIQPFMVLAGDLLHHPISAGWQLGVYVALLLVIVWLSIFGRTRGGD